jgi:hypothetical protein
MAPNRAASNRRAWEARNASPEATVERSRTRVAADATRRCPAVISPARNAAANDGSSSIARPSATSRPASRSDAPRCAQSHALAEGQPYPSAASRTSNARTNAACSACARRIDVSNAAIRAPSATSESSAGSAGSSAASPASHTRTTPVPTRPDRWAGR